MRILVQQHDFMDRVNDVKLLPRSEHVATTP